MTDATFNFTIRKEGDTYIETTVKERELPQVEADKEAGGLYEYEQLDRKVIRKGEPITKRNKVIGHKYIEQIVSVRKHTSKERIKAVKEAREEKRKEAENIIKQGLAWKEEADRIDAQLKPVFDELDSKEK